MGGRPSGWYKPLPVSVRHVLRAASPAVLVLLVAGCAVRRPAPVVFLSDFGTTDDSVAICKGVMLGIEPRLRIDSIAIGSTASIAPTMAP